MRPCDVDVDDAGVLQLGGEEVLLLALHGSAIPIDFNGRQHFAAGQSFIHQRCRLVQRAGEDEGFVDPLACRLATLWIGRYGHLVLDLLH